MELTNKYYYYYFVVCEDVFASVESYIFKIEIPKHNVGQNEVQDEKLDGPVFVKEEFEIKGKIAICTGNMIVC